MGAEHDVTEQLNEVKWTDLENAYDVGKATRNNPVSGKHVLIVGINYSPEPTGIAPYTTHIAEHLARHAASVTVLAGPPSYPAWHIEPQYRGRHRIEHSNDVEVHRLWHYVPRRQTGMRRAAYEATFGAHAASVSRRIVRKPDVVLAVIPSLAGALAAARIAERYSAPLILHVQDLMGRAAAQSGMSGGERLSGAAARMERWVAMRAQKIAIVSESFRAVLRDYGVPDERIVLMPNWTHISRPTESRERVRARLHWPADLKVVLHTGNMGWKQDLDNVVDAAKLCSSGDDLMFVLLGDGSQSASLRIAAEGVSALQILPPVTAEEYPNVLHAADILLLNERASVSEMSLPSKLTSYLATGLPIVAAVSGIGATAQALRELGLGQIVPPGDPNALLRAVMATERSPHRADVGLLASSFPEQTLMALMDDACP